MSWIYQWVLYVVIAFMICGHAYGISSSPHYVKTNAEKLQLGGAGYWAGAATYWTAVYGLHASLFWPGLLLTPVAGAIGAAAGVQIAGEMNGEACRPEKTLWGAAKGSVLGIWTWLVPVPLLYPLVTVPAMPVIYATNEHNANKRPLIDDGKKYHSLSFDPLRLLWAAARVGGGAKHMNTPIILEAERYWKKNRLWYVEVNYQDQSLSRYQSHFLDPISNQASWHKKSYGLTLGIRSYLRSTLSGLYSGIGSSLSYSSVSGLSGDVDYWGMSAGEAIFLKPFVEMGYKLDLVRNYFIQGGVQFGPSILVKGNGEHGNDSLAFLNSIDAWLAHCVIRIGRKSLSR